MYSPLLSLSAAGTFALESETTVTSAVSLLCFLFLLIHKSDHLWGIIDSYLVALKLTVHGIYLSACVVYDLYK